MEKELDSDHTTHQSTDKSQSVHAQISQLYSDVKKVEKGVQEIEDRVDRLGEHGATGRQDNLSTIVDAHYNSLRWIERNVTEMNKRLSEVRGLE